MATSLYRKNALQKVTEPEQLDEVFRVASLKSWLVLLGFGIVMVLGVLWSLLGTITTTERASGMILPRGGLGAVTAPVTGSVQQVLVRADQSVASGGVLFQVQSGHSTIKVRAPMAGRVVNLGIYPGAEVSAGQLVASVDPSHSRLVAYFYLPVSALPSLHVGTKVHVEPIAAKAVTQGYLQGVVAHIAHYPATAQAASALFQNQAVTNQLVGNAMVYQVQVRLLPGPHGGYQWSRSVTATRALPAGNLVTGAFIIGRSHPVSLLLR